MIREQDLAGYAKKIKCLCLFQTYPLYTVHAPRICLLICGNHLQFLFKQNIQHDVTADEQISKHITGLYYCLLN